MADLVYPPVLLLARSVWGALGIRFHAKGARNVPRVGGAVLASNHVSYLDFTYVGLTARPSKRLVRFMAKDSVFHHPVAGPLMRGMHHIPVDRSAGAHSYDAAVENLRRGEIVGLFPEATISRSWTLKDFKTGAARMAQSAGVPLVPMATWGGQRIYTKGRRPDLTRGRAVGLAVGEGFLVGKDDDPAEVTAELRRRVGVLLDDLQRTYPQQPAGDDDRWWLPVHLGGTAPTRAEADELDRAEKQKKAS